MLVTIEEHNNLVRGNIRRHVHAICQKQLEESSGDIETPKVI